MNTLYTYVLIADRYAHQLEYAFERVKDKLSIIAVDADQLSDEDWLNINALRGAFSALLALIEDHIFFHVLDASAESVLNLTFIDILNLLEKRNFIPSAQDWKSFHYIRQSIFYEYPQNLEKQNQHLMTVIQGGQWLYIFWKDLRLWIEKRIFEILKSSNLQYS